MTLLIDADWLLYAACSACECDIRWDEWINTLHLEQADAKSYITHQVSKWQEATGQKELIMCLSSYPTFRHQLSPEYKANRTGRRKPLGLRDLRTWIAAEWPTRCHDNLEADDVMGILMTNGQYRDPIMVTADKDMRTIPGKLLRMDVMEVNTLGDANRNWMTQTLVGDTSDNYPGLKGFGPVKAEKLLADCQTLPEMWDAVVGAYRKGGETFGAALLNARMARILRYGDYDFTSGSVELWDPDRDPAMKTNG
jgi:DNA polymerase-1